MHLVTFRLWLQNPHRFCERETRRLSQSTINAITGRVSAFYGWLHQNGNISQNPLEHGPLHVKKPSLKLQEPAGRIKTITDSDFNKILASVRSLRDKLILLLLKAGGLRKGELLGIRLEDIDFDTCGINIKRGCSGDRFVALPPYLIALTDKYIGTEWLDADPKEDFLLVVQNDRVHPGNNGKPLTNSALMSIFNYHSRKTGISVNPQILRHTHAAELVRSYLNAGDPVKWEAIKERLGHQDVSTTIGKYSHLTRDNWARPGAVTKRRRGGDVPLWEVK